MVFSDKDSDLKQKEENWNQLIKEKGLELINNSARKWVNVCCGISYLACFAVRIEPGDLILVNKILVLKGEDVHRYASFSKMLQAESLEKVLPGVKTVEEGVEIYRKFYTEEKEMSIGVLAVCVSKLAAQSYLSLASILFIKGSTLTHGARALAKHAERSGDRYWGILGGNDSTKNRLAMNVISHLIASCRWSNIHVVPQHGAVFEIRVADGYGACWSMDGTKAVEVPISKELSGKKSGFVCIKGFKSLNFMS
ncbi:RNA-BINDING ASCH DOMAIN PROTEIN [Salix purpurea]|uniref:RNA-BINDING ASCH DOMAIN PROTEIN n=1 Tax=Salix purpurea TaxID=77065 RepID=A0A9Q0ZNR8_SALPP|nr:RNA-BINDING ASCH DOMAIN PROTEIN [Salix purpurea]